MQKVLTAAQMREVDRRTTEEYGIPSIILMENAAHAVARVITEELGGSVKGKSILILCGPGNNGGDGAALARILWTLGAKVEVLLRTDWRLAKGDAAINFDLLSRLKGRVGLITLDSSKGLRDHWTYVRSNRRLDAIVDAVFGTGLTRPLSDEYTSFLDIARDYTLDIEPVPVFAVDIPSGLNADGGEPNTCPLEATVTVTFTAPKPSLVLPPSNEEVGELITASIGSPQDLIDSFPSELFVSTSDDCRVWFWSSRFTDSSYKNKRGHALLIAGSKDYSGAAALCGNSAIRSGVGLVTLACPADAKAEIASRLLPEVILSTLESPELADHVSKADAIAVGCGLDANDPEIERAVKHVVATRNVPVVIDASALWFYSPFDKAYAGETPAVRPSLILTPHQGEFMRLLGTEDKEVIKDRVAAVRDFATKNNVILVLKGERVLIGAPDGRVIVNPTGNSGLGKAGNGDTLTGILVGFVTQAVQMKIDIVETVVAACYVAGMAGDVAEKKYGKRVMTASDVRECLVEVFNILEAN